LVIEASQIGTIYILDIVPVTSQSTAEGPGQAGSPVLPWLLRLPLIRTHLEKTLKRLTKVWRLCGRINFLMDEFCQGRRATVLCGLKVTGSVFGYVNSRHVDVSIVWVRVGNVFDGIHKGHVSGIASTYTQGVYPTCLNVQNCWTWLLHDVCISTCFHQGWKDNIQVLQFFVMPGLGCCVPILHNVGHDFFCICLQPLYVMLCGDSRWICVLAQ
jgi:hypothetical protein